MKEIRVLVTNGKRKMLIINKFTDTKEDVREKVADIILGNKK